MIDSSKKKNFVDNEPSRKVWYHVFCNGATSARPLIYSIFLCTSVGKTGFFEEKINFFDVYETTKLRWWWYKLEQNFGEVKKIYSWSYAITCAELTLAIDIFMFDGEAYVEQLIISPMHVQCRLQKEFLSFLSPQNEKTSEKLTVPFTLSNEADVLNKNLLFKPLDHWSFVQSVS